MWITVRRNKRTDRGRSEGGRIRVAVAGGNVQRRLAHLWCLANRTGLDYYCRSLRVRIRAIFILKQRSDFLIGTVNYELCHVEQNKFISLATFSRRILQECS